MLKLIRTLLHQMILLLYDNSILRTKYQEWDGKWSTTLNPFSELETFGGLGGLEFSLVLIDGMDECPMNILNLMNLMNNYMLLTYDTTSFSFLNDSMKNPL